MHYHTLGNTNLQVSVIGLGGWALGGGTDWGATDFADVCATVSAALDVGINLVDTAPIYGDSESVLGCALQGHRQEVILSTKCGLVRNGSWTDHDLRPVTIAKQLENSLRVLKTDFIDLYWIHYLDPKIPWQEVLKTLEKFKQQGKIREIGVCNIPLEMLPLILQTGLVSCVQDELSLLHPVKGQMILKLCRAQAVGFISYGSLGGGILSGKYKQEPNFRRSDARNYFYKCYRGESFTQTQQKVNCVRAVAAQHQIAPAQAALAWVLAQEGVTCALTGARNAAQIRQNAQTCDICLGKKDLCNLQK